MWWFILITVVAVIVWLFVRASRSYRSELFEVAQEAERAGRFEDATYYYGEALYHHAPEPEKLRDRIRGLWSAHGPFTFAAARARISERMDEDRDGDLEIFDDIVKIIQQAASGQKERRAFEV